MSAYCKWFDEGSSTALDDAQLRCALEAAAGKKMVSRNAAVAELERFEQLRDLAAQIKQHTIENLEQYVSQFAANAKAAGAVVHHAQTTDDSNRIITDIAGQNSLKTCVKVKSMTTEETGLNHALEAAGLRVVETDLGEFIVQLDEDRPSHIVSPIIHKNRKSIATTMAGKLGHEYTEDAETLTVNARSYLRSIFRYCDMGVSGANFAVAETGTICICTNEGNGRLTVTRPKVHVALVGVEKVIPRMVDLALFLKLLARSSTGQPITVYNSLITGPRRESEPAGPDQLHVVLLDGGRRKIAAGEYKQVLRCIRCGGCLNTCPVYRRIGGHSYGNVYPGPIGALLGPLLNDFDKYADLPQASSLCGRCREVCPVRINIPDMLVRLRRDQVKRKRAGFLRRTAFRLTVLMMSRPLLYRTSQWFARIGAKFLARDGWIEKMPWPFSDWTRERSLKCPADETFRRIWKKSLAEEGHRSGQE